MKKTDVWIDPVSRGRVPSVLHANGIRINEYAKLYLDHPRCFSDPFSGSVRVVIVSLRELGFQTGATLNEILARVPSLGFRPCRPDMGLYLRLALSDQSKSRNAVLTGQHRSPDGAITVLSEPPEADDAFPKGLYLRNVEGTLWLRGYVCDASYRWSPDDLFAVEEL